jgi:hypothetical protein
MPSKALKWVKFERVKTFFEIFIKSDTYLKEIDLVVLLEMLIRMTNKERQTTVGETNMKYFLVW